MKTNILLLGDKPVVVKGFGEGAGLGDIKTNKKWIIRSCRTPLVVLGDTKQNILFVILLCASRLIPTHDPCFRLLIQSDFIRTELYLDLIMWRSHLIRILY